MANILKYITGGDNILKRQTAEEDNKTKLKKIKGKRIFQNIYEKRCNWRHLADNARCIFCGLRDWHKIEMLMLY